MVTIALASSLYFGLKKIKSNYTHKYEQKQLEDLITYTKKLESNQQQLRKFKHDYFNILLSLQSTIDTENIQLIKQEFHKINHYSKKNLIDHSALFNDLNNLNILPIKSIFLSKFLYWDEFQLKHISFECRTSINNLNIDNIILIRILGNLLDNAYEELTTQENPERFIQIAIIDEPKINEIIISNSLKTATKHFSILSQINYTTKDNHSGLGLTTVSSLIKDEPSIEFFTDITASVYTTSIIITKK